jgi:DUF971 family protein
VTYNRVMDAAGSPTTPVSIHADRAARSLEIAWADGHRTAYDFVALRWLCPCAYCRGEAGMPGWLDSAPRLTPEQTRMTDVQLVGQYAIAPTWGDGHGTGFYTFQLLRDRCPCDECGRRRGARTDDGPTRTHADHAADPAADRAATGRE